MVQILPSVMNGCKQTFQPITQDWWREVRVLRVVGVGTTPPIFYMSVVVSDQVEGLSVEDGKRQTRGERNIWQRPSLYRSIMQRKLCVGGKASKAARKTKKKLQFVSSLF
jgi:hypothetical protein